MEARSVSDYRTGVADELQRACDEVRTRYAGLPGELLAWKLDEESWSVSECLEHLTVTNGAYRNVLLPSLERARRRGVGPGTEFRGGRFGRWFAGVVGPKVGIKVRAPKVFRPGVAAVPEGAPERFIRSQEEIREVLDSAVSVELDRVMVRSPVTPLIRFRLGDVFLIITAHARRHLEQAARVTEAPGFPGT
jgi:hypothetical protein